MPPLEADIDRRIAYSARGHAWGDDPDLTALSGVGDKTAERLRAAGIRRPEDLQGKSIEEISAIEGIGRQTAAKIRSEVEYTRPSGLKSAIVTGEGDERQFHGFVHTSRQVKPEVAGETGVTEDPGREVEWYGGKDDVPVVPGTVGIEGDDKDRALAAHAERSFESRNADESFNAPVTLSYPQWAANPNRYDYPGVDTIPRSRKRKRVLARAGRLFEEGGIKDFRTDPENWGSSFMRGRQRRLTLGRSEDPEGVFAHEVGHALESHVRDPFADTMPAASMFEDPETMEQAERISERRRGEPIETTRRMYGVDIFEGTDWERDRTDEQKETEFKSELFADVFASMVTEPRATRREAPKAVREVKGLLHGTGYLRRERWPDLEDGI